MIRPRIFLGLAAAALASTSAAQNLLNNGDFDTNINDWTILASPEISVQWTAVGNPDGGLEMWTTATTAPGIYAEAQSPCLNLEEGDHLFRGDVLAQGLNAGPGCGVNRLRYFNTTCSGGPATTDSFSNVDGVWTTSEGPFTVHDPAGNSYRIILSMIQSSGDSGPRGCVFDNVALFGPTPSSLEIPTVNRIGLGTLALLLAGVAVVVLRRT